MRAKEGDVCVCVCRRGEEKSGGRGVRRFVPRGFSMALRWLAILDTTG